MRLRGTNLAWNPVNSMSRWQGADGVSNPACLDPRTPRVPDGAEHGPSRSPGDLPQSRSGFASSRTGNWQSLGGTAILTSRQATLPGRLATRHVFPRSDTRRLAGVAAGVAGSAPIGAPYREHACVVEWGRPGATGCAGLPLPHHSVFGGNHSGREQCRT